MSGLGLDIKAYLDPEGISFWCSFLHTYGSRDVGSFFCIQWPLESGIFFHS